MNTYVQDEQLLRQLAADIERLPPRPHHAALMEAAGQRLPGAIFRHTLSRGGWYRPGGVLAADGARVADSIEHWARAELKTRDGDVDQWVDSYIDSGLIVTRHTGRTHYFASQYGPAPADFLQLEVEETQEVLDRQLIDPEHPPADLQELTEPVNPILLEAQPVGAPHYRFRRLLDVRQTLARSAERARNLARLLKEWNHSSAATRGHFSEYWIVALREHLDRYRNPVVSLSLVSLQARKLKPFQWDETLTGVEMAAQLQAYDRAAGYPAAWYFHLAVALTPPKVAYAVARDLEAGFSYLPDTEAELVKGWVAEPYSV